MITLFLVACQIELEQVDLRNAVKAHLPKDQQVRTADDLWVEQCVARKQAGL